MPNINTDISNKTQLSHIKIIGPGKQLASSQWQLIQYQKCDERRKMILCFPHVFQAIHHLIKTDSMRNKIKIIKWLAQSEQDFIKLLSLS